jgi:hypothetical protein
MYLQFLGVKERADVGASIAEQVGLAKECSAALIIGATPPSGCTAGTGGTYTSIAAGTKSEGIKCGTGVTAASKTCIATVSADGAVSIAVQG